MIGFLTAGAKDVVTMAPVAQLGDWGTATSGVVWASQTEERMVEAVRQAGIPAPNGAHVLLPPEAPVAEADLYYEADGKRVAVLLHGGAHDGALQSGVDAEKEQKLLAKGYTVVVVHHEDIDAGTTKLRHKLGLVG